jgi:cell division septation protein DedD
MRRPATWSTRLARAALMALVPLTIIAQVALAHFPPISQTFRSGVTLTSFSGTFEVIWPSEVYVAGAVIELRDEANNPLLQASEGAAVELDVPCPEFGDRYSCARIRLTDIPALAPGSYVMYWRVEHLDDYVEQRAVRFTIDPNWVSPSPTATPPSPTASASPTPPSPTPVSPSPTLTSAPTTTAPPTSSPSNTPTTSTSAGPATPGPSPTPTTAPSPGPQPEGNGAIGLVGPLALGLFVLLTATLIRRYRRHR